MSVEGALRARGLRDECGVWGAVYFDGNSIPEF
jgi:hypothetical protein